MRKAVSPVVAVALLLFVVVGAAVGFQSWYNQYSSSVLSDAEERDTLTTGIRIESLVGSSLYIYSGKETNISFLSIRDSSGNVKCSYDTVSNNDSLYAYWDFDSRNSSHALELTGNSSAAQLEDSLSGNSDGVGLPTYGPGKVGSAIVMDGIDDLLNVSDDFYFNQFTIQTWVKPNQVSNSGAKGIIGKRAGANEWTVRLEIDNTAYFLSWNTSGGTFVNPNTDPVFAAGEWMNLITVVNGTRGSLYYNGLLNASDNSNSGSLLNSISNIFIGRDSTDTTRTWNGSLDEIKIFNRALNVTEVRNLYYFNDVFLDLETGLNIIDVPGCNLTNAETYEISVFSQFSNSQKEIVKR